MHVLKVRVNSIESSRFIWIFVLSKDAPQHNHNDFQEEEEELSKSALAVVLLKLRMLRSLDLLFIHLVVN